MSETKDNALQEWLEAFPVEKVRAELRDLEAEAGRIEYEIRNRRRLLEARDEALGIAESDNGQVHMRTGELSTETLRRRRNAAAHNAATARRVSAAQSALERTNRAVLAAAIRDVEEGVASVGAAAPARSEDPNQNTTQEPHPPTKHLSRADKLLDFLARHRGEKWKLSDIRDRLVEEGLLADSEADTHGLQVSASRLARTGRLERPAAGVYRLAPITPEGAEG